MDFNMLTRFSTAPRIVTWSFEGRREDVNVNGFGDVGGKVKLHFFWVCVWDKLMME